jgi:multiple sugar transport system permease protein
MGKAAVSSGKPRQVFWRRLMPGGREFQRSSLGVVLVVPLLLVLLGLLAYPIFWSALLSLQSKSPGQTAQFIGLANYVETFKDSAISDVVVNTIFYAVVSVILKTIIGLAMALVLNEAIPARNFFRSWLLLPWIAPVLVTALTWRWMFAETGGIINFVLMGLGLAHMPPAWLASRWLARLALVIANTWRGFPFFGITLLAGLQSIPTELYEAAEIDGASIWQRIRSITLPLLEPVLLIVVILSTIWTFNDFTLVWILTQGGPSNSTHLFATYSFFQAFRANRYGYAAAVSLVATPLLLIFIAALAPRMWKEEA